MDFNTFSLCYCLFWSAACVLIYLASARLKRTLRIGTRPNQNDAGFSQRNASFRGCQKSFLVGYAPCLLADGLQAPYLYYVFISAGLAPTQIAGLYILGYLSSAAAAIGALHISDRIERRLLCLAYVAASVFACLLKLSDSFHVLAISRIFDGVSAALLSMPFNQWYTSEHIERFDFPKEWLSSTLRRVAVLGGFCAIAAGFLAQIGVSTIHLAPMPFLLAVPVLITSGFIMHFTWQPNRSEAPPNSVVVPGCFSRITHTAALVVKDVASTLLFTIQSLYECALLVFIFLYTPVFMDVRLITRNLPSLGVVYACMAASALFGQQACAVLLASLGTGAGDRKHAASLAGLSLSLASSLTSVSLMLALDTSSRQESGAKMATFNTLLVLFAVLHAAAGAYYAALPVVQKHTLRSISDRPALAALSRLSRCTLATAALLSTGSAQTHLLIGAGAIVLALALAASLALAAVALARRRRRPPVQDYVVLRQMDQALDDSEDDDVFA